MSLPRTEPSGGTRRRTLRLVAPTLPRNRLGCALALVCPCARTPRPGDQLAGSDHRPRRPVLGDGDEADRLVQAACRIVLAHAETESPVPRIDARLDELDEQPT